MYTKMKINYKALYESRICEIEIQVIKSIQYKDWKLRDKLLKERKELLERVKQMG